MIPLLPQGVLRKQSDPDGGRLNLKLPPASAGGIQQPEQTARGSYAIFAVFTQAIAGSPSSIVCHDSPVSFEPKSFPLRVPK